MVCEKCEKKLSTVITQDPWKAGARNTLESGGRKLNENKLLTQSSRTKAASGSSDTSRHQFRDCGICKAKCHQVGSYYCQHCAYKKGICSMCGIKIANTRDYNQSSAQLIYSLISKKLFVIYFHLMRSPIQEIPLSKIQCSVQLADEFQIYCPYSTQMNKFIPDHYRLASSISIGIIGTNHLSLIGIQIADDIYSFASPTRRKFNSVRQTSSMLNLPDFERQ